MIAVIAVNQVRIEIIQGNIKKQINDCLNSTGAMYVPLYVTLKKHVQPFIIFTDEALIPGVTSFNYGTHARGYKLQLR